MKYTTSNMQKGVGLIEVLIATVVIAVGLLAVASLQGGFIASSSDSKIRSEALTLAEQKIEELKNNINLAGYNATPNSSTSVNDAANPIVGTNASFTRSWVIDEGGSEERKNVSVIVSWGNGADEKVNLVTEMTFIDPAKSALYAGINATGGGTGAVPSPRQNASEDVASENVIGTDLAITDMNLDTTGTAGVDSQVQVDPDNSGTLITLSQVAAGSHFYTVTHSVLSTVNAGVIAVFLCDDSDNDITTPDTCTHIQNHFGGVVHRVIGTVFSTSGHGLSDILVAWTSSDVHACYVGTPVRTPSTGTFQYDSMPYECVFAGNCNTSAAGTRTASGTGVTNPGCFVDSVVSDTQINDKNVGPGGEFGDIGLLGLDYQGGGQEQVCFLEDTTDPASSPLLNTSGSDVLNENYLFAVTKRFYISRRVQRNGSINDHKSEGINRSYSNHNFYIISRGSGASAKTKCNTEVAITSATQQQVAPREISRAFNQNTANTVAAEAAYTGSIGTAHTLTGNVTGSATKLRLFIPETGTCYPNNALDRTADSTGYACVVPSNATSVEIIGSSNQHKSSDPSVFASCTKTANTTPGCHWLTDFTNTYNDGSGSSSCTTPWGASLADASAVDAYSASDCSTAISRTCSSGSLSGDSTAIYETSAACVTATTNASCASPWIGGPDIAHGASVNAYTSSSVAFGSTCPTVVSRTCNNGTLSGDSSAIFQSCTVDAGATYDIVVTAANGSGSIAVKTCNSGSCSLLPAATYTLSVQLDNNDTCTKDYTISNSNVSVVVTKGSGSSTTCTMAP